MRKNPGLRISDYDVAGVMHDAYKKVCNLKIVENGFNCTGIYPLNPNIFTENDFTPCLITDIQVYRNRENQSQEEAISKENSDQSMQINTDAEKSFDSQIHQLLPLPDTENLKGQFTKTTK